MTCKWYSLCPLRRFERLGLLDDSWADTYCRSDNRWRECKRYQLEEAGDYHPDSMLPDGRIHDALDTC
ncbi:MAG: uracil-DNA glycosylase [Deltaproteobacteria bacterium]|nr:uracil-DNA glycosylase [Deltaproteobacteria bacterium]